MLSPLPKYLQTKYQSSTLVYAVFVMLVIALICSSLIMMSYYHKTLYNSYIEKDRVFSNVNSGITLMLGDTGIVKPGEVKKLSLYQKYNDSVELEKDDWGVFELVRSKSWWKKFSFEKIAISGDFYKDDSSYALFLVDQNKPLSVCGNTLIKGDCYLPKAGVEKAYIEGKSFGRGKLVDGLIKESKRFLPSISDRFSTIDSAYFKEKYIDNTGNTLIDLEDVENDSLINAFLETIVIIYNYDDVFIDNIYLSGNILLYCESTLEISSTCKFEDILIYGKSVWIEEGFKGSCQVFAKDTINIGKNCRFQYPSVLGLINDNREGKTNPSVINIENGSRFSGLIYSSCNSEVITIEPILKTYENVSLTGQVYWAGVFDFKGEVYGAVSCKKFLLKTPSSIYENHLLDVTIDLDRLSEHFVGVDMVGNTKTKKIIKWL